MEYNSNMPVYEYICVPCDLDFTKSRSINEDDPGYFCDTCGYKLNRVYSKVEAVFNGSGFYSTENRKK